MSKLSREERELLESLERGEWRSVPNLEAEKKRFQKIAAATLKKRRTFTIMISERDLLAIEEHAFEAGIPYPKFVAKLVHRYVSGQLVERKIKTKAG